MPSDSGNREPLRLLWLIDSLTLGGAESLVLQFAQAIDPREIALRVCCLKSIGGNAMEERLRQAGVPVVNLEAKNLRDIGAFRRLLALLREERIEIVHAHLTYAVIWGVLACRRRKIPIVASLHVAPTSDRGYTRDSIREWLMIEVLRWHRATTVAVSAAVRTMFAQKYSLPPARIQLVRNGVKALTYERRNNERAIHLRQQFKFPPNARILITVAALRAPKGIDILLRALQSVVKTIPEARLLIVGEGPMQEQWSKLAQHLGVAELVRWAGFREDVPVLLAGSDAFVLPSREDAFPTVLLEAMAAEVPIVATTVGGVPEIINSDSTGVLVPPADPAALAAAITRVLHDPAASRAVAAAARRRVAEEFSGERWLESLMKLYRHAVGQRHGRVRIAVVEFTGKGGLIHYTFQLCRAMSAHGADVTLVTDENYEMVALEHSFRVVKLFKLWDPKPAQAPRGGERARGRGGEKERSAAASSPPRPLAPSPSRFFLRGRRALQYYREWMRLLSHIRDERYHVVQFGDLRFPTDFFPLRLIRPHVPLLADICHNVRPFTAGGKFSASANAEKLYRRMYRLFDRIFVHYNTNLKEFRKAFPESGPKTNVIVHGNEEIFRELRGPLMTGNRLRTHMGFFPGDDVVLFFGTLTAYKGIDVLIEAFASVALRRPRSHLVIAGFALPDFDVDEHVRLARHLGCGDRLRIEEGYVDSSAVAAWMELASVIVFPYRDVYQSGALHLALTFGVPIVATNVGATAEVIEHGVTGLLVSPNSPDELADGISTLLEDRELAGQLSAAARAAAEERFGWSAVARQVLDAYEQRLDRRTG